MQQYKAIVLFIITICIPFFAICQQDNRGSGEVKINVETDSINELEEKRSKLNGDDVIKGHYKVGLDSAFIRVYKGDSLVGQFYCRKDMALTPRYPLAAGVYNIAASKPGYESDSLVGVLVKANYTSYRTMQLKHITVKKKRK